MWTIQAKAILAAVILALIGYSYLWTYKQGQLTGRASEVAIQMEVLRKNQLEFNELRAKELREARANYEQELLNQKKRVKDLNAANTILNQQITKNAKLMDIVPDSLISLLNESRRDFGFAPEPPSGTNGKVSPPA